MGNLHEVKKRNICKLAVIASLTGVCRKLANFGLGGDWDIGQVEAVATCCVVGCYERE
jgi:hypothetical protein